MSRILFLSILTCYLLLCVPFTGLRAQSTTSNQFWTDITVVHHLDQRWRYSGDLGARGLFSNEEWTQVYARPTFVYQIHAWLDLRAGVGLFQTWNKNSEHQQEFRLHQEINLKWPNIAGFVFQHMIRVEERQFFNELSENDLSARLRYRPTVETPDFSIFGKAKHLYGTAGIDIFIPLGEASQELFVNNYRLLSGLGYRFGEGHKIQLEFFRQHSRAISTNGFKTAQNVLRLRFQVTVGKLEQAG